MLLLQFLAVCLLALLAPPVTAPFPPCSPLTFINQVVQSSNLSYLYIYIFYICISISRWCSPPTSPIYISIYIYLYLYLGGAVLQPLLRPPPLLPRAPLHLQGRHPGGTAQGGPGRCVHQGMECLLKIQTNVCEDFKSWRRPLLATRTFS